MLLCKNNELYQCFVKGIDNRYPYAIWMLLCKPMSDASKAELHVQGD